MHTNVPKVPPLQPGSLAIRPVTKEKLTTLAPSSRGEYEMRESKQVKRTSFRLRQESYDALFKKAAKAGVTTREWLEEAILKPHPDR